MLGTPDTPSTEPTSAMAFCWLKLTQLDHPVIHPDLSLKFCANFVSFLGAHKLGNQNPGIYSHRLAFALTTFDGGSIVHQDSIAYSLRVGVRPFSVSHQGHKPHFTCLLMHATSR